MADETQDKKIHSGDLSVGLIQGMDRLSPSLIKAIDGILWLIAILIALIFIYLVGQILFFMLDVSNSKSIQGIEEFNKVLITVGSLVGALITLGFLVWRTMIAQKQNTIAQENIHSTTMAKAIEQLGAMKEEKVTPGRAIPDGSPPPETVTNSKPNIEVRLGAIYLLEKLAREHEQLHWPIMEILCAYVRENAGGPRPYSYRKPRVDIQAAITVIGRRSVSQLNWERNLRQNDERRKNYRIDISNCHLAGAKFDGLNFRHAILSKSCLNNVTMESAHFESADLSNTLLEGASLSGGYFENTKFLYAHLTGSSVFNAHLEGALFWYTYCEGLDFMGAYVDRVDFHHASLQGADFLNVDLGRANFHFADVEDARIDGANLLRVRNFPKSKINMTWGDEETVLPEGITRPFNSNWVKDAVNNQARSISWRENRENWIEKAKSRKYFIEMEDDDVPNIPF